MTVQVISAQNIFRSSAGSISLTIPTDCEAVYIFLGGNYSSTGGYFGGTLAGASPDASVMSPGQSGYTQGGCLAFIGPPTGSQTFSLTLSGALVIGLAGLAVYVKGGDYTDGWRDAGTDNKTGTSTCSVTIDSESTDLVLALHGRITSYPGPPTGWTKVGSNSGYNSEYTIGQKCDAPGASSTNVITAYSNYSCVVGISIPEAAGATEYEVDTDEGAGFNASADAYVVVDYSDNFTGSDGDPPDSDKWEVVENTNDAWEIANNRLDIHYTTSPYTPENSYLDLRGKYKFAGDFDIQISHTRFQMSSSGTPIWVTLEVINEDTEQWAGIGFYSGNGSYGFFTCDDTGTLSPHNRVNSRSDLDNDFRVTRVGSTIVCYFYDISRAAWEGNYGDTDGWTMRSISGDVRVRLAGFAPQGKSCWVGLDTFTINSGTADPYTPPVNAETSEGAGFNALIEAKQYPQYGPVDENAGFESEIDAAGSIYNRSISEGAGFADDFNAAFDVEPTYHETSEGAGFSDEVDATVFIDYDDNFTGSDGDPPDASKWEIVENTNDVGCIRSNAYGFNFSLSPYCPEPSTLDVRGKYLLRGDFDIQINMVRWSTGNGVGGYHYSVLEVKNADDTEFAFAGYYQNGLYGCFCGDTDGTLTPHNRKANYSTTSNLNFRLTRVDGVITAYRWSGSAWTGFGSSSGYTLKTITDDVRVRLLQYVPTGAKFGMSFDNFVINSGETVPYVLPVDAGTSEGAGFESEINAEIIYEIGTGDEAGFNAEVDANFAEMHAGTSEGAGFDLDIDAEIEGVHNIIGAAGFADEVEAQATYNENDLGESAGFNADVDAYAVVEIPALVDEGAGFNAGVDAEKIEWVSPWNDDFTGSNGDPPNSDIWTVNEDRTPAEAIIDSNALDINLIPGAGATYDFEMVGKWMFNYNFDIQIDFTRYAESWEYGDHAYALFEIVGGAAFRSVGWHYGTGDYKWRVGADYGVDPQGYVSGYWVPDITKFRIVRDTGYQLKAYFWNNAYSRWEFNSNPAGYSFAAGLFGDVQVRIRVHAGGSGSLHYKFDNFKVNVGLYTTDIDFYKTAAGNAGFADEIDAVREFERMEANAGFTDEIDAVDPNGVVPEVAGFSDDFSTAGNILNVELDNPDFWTTNAGFHDEIDAQHYTPREFETAGFHDSISVDFDTKNIFDEAGFNAFVDGYRQWEKGIDAGAGFTDEIDAYNYTDWQRKYLVKAKKVLLLRLTGAANGLDDLVMPMSTFSARKRQDAQTFIQVVVAYDYAEEIVNRSNGQLVIDGAFLIDGEISLREEIIRADFDTLNESKGPRSRSLTLTGYMTAVYNSKNITLTRPTYRNYQSGKITYRFVDIDFFLNPGDVVTVDDDTYTVGSVSYYANPDRQQMEVSEEK